MKILITTTILIHVPTSLIDDGMETLFFRVWTIRSVTRVNVFIWWEIKPKQDNEDVQGICSWSNLKINPHFYVLRDTKCTCMVYL